MWKRTVTGIVATVAVVTFGWPAVASAAPQGAGGHKPAGSTPAVGRQSGFSTKTETTTGTATSPGVARDVSQNTTSSTGQLLVLPKPVSQLASLIGDSGFVNSLASGEFSASGHQDVAAVICTSLTNDQCSYGQTPFQNGPQGQFSIVVLPGNGDGTFGAPTQLTPVGPDIALSMIAATDLGNGHPDLVVSENARIDGNPNQFLIYLGKGDGTFQSPPIAVDSPGPILRFQVADLGNGHPDLVAMVTGGTDGNEVVVFAGDGKGDFTAETPMPLCPGMPSGCPATNSTTDLVVAPLANGGAPDILVSLDTGYDLNNGYQNSTDVLAEFLNNGSGTFSAPSYPITNMNDVEGMEVGDFTGPSGPPDVLLAGNFLGNLSGSSNSFTGQLLLRGNGDGTFQTPNPNDTTTLENNPVRGAVLDTPIDLNGDGSPDALWLSNYGNQQSQAVEAMINNGSGRFTPEEMIGAGAGGVYASTVLPVDLTGSGHPDLLVGGAPIGAVSGSPYLWVVPANSKAPGTFLTAQGLQPDPLYAFNNSTGQASTQYDESVAVGDFRNTGHQDIVSVTNNNKNGSQVTLLPGNGDGTYGPPQTTGYSSSASSVFPRAGLVSGDFNGDGNQDIAWFDNNGGFDYQLGDGDGTFGPVVQIPPDLSVAVGGPPDLVETTLNGVTDIIASLPVFGSPNQDLEAWLWNSATSTFNPPVVSRGLPALQSGDDDIAVGHFKAGDPVDLAGVFQPSGGVPQVDVITGNADGSFNTATPTVVAAPCSTDTGGSNNFSYGAIAVGNLGNGHDDIVWQCINTLDVALGNGDGTFQPTQSFPEQIVGNNTGLILADLEGNGHLDAVAWGGDNGCRGMAVWHGNGDGTFSASQYLPLGLPINCNLGEGLTAAPLTSPGIDDLISLGTPGQNATDEMAVFLSTGGRPSLETTQVSTPSPATPAPGNIVTGTYQVTNTGAAVSSSWDDSVYLAPGSTGTDWSTSDTLLGRVPQSQALASGGSYTGQFSFPLGNVPTGTWHLIVVPDSSDVLSGGNETPGASAAFTIGPIPTLTAGSPLSTGIQAGQTLYYQVAVTSGTDVQVAVSGLPSGSTVSLLGQNGEVPDPQSATVGSSKSGTVTLPGSSAGTWYLVIDPSASVGTTPVPVTVSATTLGFTVDSVSPRVHVIAVPPPVSSCIGSAAGGGGGRTECPPPPPPPPCCGDGHMTLTLQGSDFASDLNVQLTEGSETFTATTITRRDSTVAYASFPVASFGTFLSGSSIVGPGIYNVVVSSGGSETTLANWLTVETREYIAPTNVPIAPFSVTFSAPTFLRQGWAGQLAVTIANNTDSDIAVPVVDVSSPNALYGAPGVTDTQDFTSDLEIDDPVLSTSPLDDPSPPGVLGGEQSFTFDLSILSNTGVQHTALETDTSIVNSTDYKAIDWGTLLAGYQPGNMPTTQWNSVISDFAGTFGGTISAFSQSLLKVFDQAKQYGVSLSDEGDAVGFMLDEVLATYPQAPVTGTLYLSDASHPLGNVPLTLTSSTDPSVAYTATSWYDGRFAFANVPGGTYDLSAAGYLPSVIETVNVSPTATGLSVVAQPGATVAGVVTDQDGVTPVTGALVSATDSTGTTLSGGPTGSDGKYSISGLAPGQITVSASATGFEQSADTQVSAPAATTTTVDVSIQQDGNIAGTVSAPGGGAPSSATVNATLVSGGPIVPGTVNSDGTYSIAGLAPGNYTVVAESPGTGPAVSTPVTVIPGGTTGSTDLTLAAAGATVTGVVTDSDTGAPIANAVVATTTDNGADGPVTTAADGSYTLGGLSTGTVQLGVDSPDSSHLDATTSVSVTNGQTTTANVTVDPAGSVTATIQASGTGTPLTDQTVTVVGPTPGISSAPESSQQDVTDSSGNVDVTGLPAGNYDLQVSGSDVHQGFSIAPGARSATLTMDVPVGTLSGQVTDAGGTGVAGITVGLYDGTGQVTTTQTDTNGDYSFTTTSAGPYDVEANGPAVGVVADSGVSAPTGQTTTAPLLQAGTAGLTVTVANGSGAVSGAPVSLDQAAADGQLVGVTGTTDASGSVTLSNLTPGSYQLAVTDGTDAASTQTISVGAGSTTLPVTLGPGGTISGTVTDSTSAPISNAVVSVVDASGSAFSATSDSSGGYSINGVPAGTYTVAATSNGDAPTEVTGVTVSSGGTATANPVLPTTGSTLAVTLSPGVGGEVPDATAVLEDSNGVALNSQQVGPAVSASDATATATFKPVTPGSYTIAVSAPGTATTTKAVTVGSGTTTTSVAAPLGEVLPGPSATAPTASAVGPASIRSKAGPLEGGGPPPTSLQFWQQDWNFFWKNWSNLLQPEVGNDPGYYQTALDTYNTDLFNWGGSSPPCFNPLFAKAQAYLQAMNEALSRLQTDNHQLQEAAFDQGWLVAGKGFAFIGAISLAAAAVLAAGEAVTAFGIPAAPLVSKISVAGIIGDAYNDIASLTDPSTIVEGMEGWEGALQKIAMDESELPEKVFTYLAKALKAAEAAIDIGKQLQDAMHQITPIVKDGKTADKNFQYFKSVFYNALAAANSYECPKKPLPNKPVPVPGPKYSYFNPENTHPGDPNEILGPPGDGTAAKYVDGGTTLPYTIFFKNEPTASAPATKVVVTIPLPAGTDPSTVRLTGFGFGQTSVPISGDVTSFSQMLTGLHLASGDDVSATGSFDPATNAITWTLEGINPATGDIDGTPQGGFLPPDDAAGDGEGYVSFQVDAKPGLANGTKISAQGSIVFDTNAAISTNTWVNTINAVAPTATVKPLPVEVTGPFEVSWSGKVTASPIASYDVYVSIDNKVWTLWQSGVKGTSAIYPGVVGHLYQFAATATDLLGNTSRVPDTSQAFTVVVKSLYPTVIGYRLVASDGGLFAFGKGVGYYGSTGGQSLAAPIVGMATTPDGKGYWLAGANGRVFSFGDAHNYGSTGALAAPIVAIAATPDGKGYWLAGANGRVFAFGDAHNYGSTGRLNKPIVGLAATPDGKGYWLVATDGGIFTFGDAHFYGSTGAVRLHKPILGMATTPDGRGYWLVASDGGIFTFGDAHFYGSTGAVRLHKPIVGMATTPDGRGYWLVASDGGIFTFGDARFFGSTGAIALKKPIVGMNLVP